MATLAKTFGGSAAVAANTTEGKFKRLNVALGEVQESIGLALLPAVEAVLPYLISFGTWAQDHVGTLMAVGTAIAAISTALIGFKAAQLIANAVTVVTTALNWSLAASAAAAQKRASAAGLSLIHNLPPASQRCTSFSRAACC